MKYRFVPNLQSLSYNNEVFRLNQEQTIYGVNESLMRLLQSEVEKLRGIVLSLEIVKDVHPHQIWIGSEPNEKTEHQFSCQQEYMIEIRTNHVNLEAGSKQGLFYAIQTLRQVLIQSEDGSLQGLAAKDKPALNYRGLQLDFSRGKTFSLETVRQVIDLMARHKMNVLQLYIEHTFAFQKHPSFCDDVGAITPDFVRAVQEYCEQNYIELQPNFQSFGHCNRILTQPEYRELSESDLYWTLSPSKPETYDLLTDFYEEFLPLFNSPLVNVGSDETYDLGLGLSKEWKQRDGKGRVYLSHILRLRELAKKHGKNIMFFGDVLINYPELLNEIPDDVVLLDWIYDPMKEYPNTKEFGKSGRRFWVCPGTGGWNSIFPRLQGAKINIERLVKTGLQHGAEGMLLTDWGDHGHYGVLSANFYSYLLGAAVSWEGETFDLEEFERGISDVSFLGGPWVELFNGFASIYDLPAIWSKNRSQCVIALFDEPLFGQTVAGPVPPENLLPLEPLPPEVPFAMEEEGHHWMRPIFQLTDEVLDEIDRLIRGLEPKIMQISDQVARMEFEFMANCFKLITKKTRFGKQVREAFATRNITLDMLLDFELEVQRLKQSYVRLLMNFEQVWFARSGEAEIYISVTYFANIISRLDYVHQWLARQRKAMNKNLLVDMDFTTYETVGYQSLPTF